jgi:DNA-binding response OmpR family regulator
MTTQQGRSILIIEDDEDYTQHIIDRLEWQGYRFIQAVTGQTGLVDAKKHRPDVIILDVRLASEHEGFQILRELQADPATRDIPVIVNSVKAEDVELRTNGINLGAWYCLNKHEGLAELEAIVRRAIQIRYGIASGMAELRLSPLDYDRETGTVWINRKATDVKLSREQGKLLALLVERAGQICSRDLIAEAVYQSEAISNQQIDRMVGRLREKLGDDAVESQFIESVRGVGYKLRITNSALP